MAEVTDTIFRWRLGRAGPAHLIQRVTDDADFDVRVDPETLLLVRYNRIIRLVINSPRGGRFAFGAAARLKSEQQLIGLQANRQINVAGRVTTEGFSWDFTPDHVPVIPSSVSNPSLLTSGGSNAGGNDTTAAFTPTASSLLVVAWTSNASENGHAFTNTHTGSGTWAHPTPQVVAGCVHTQARCQMGASPGSGTVTNTYTGTPTRTSWIVTETTGHDTPTSLSESNIGGATTGETLAISIASVAAGNLAISSMGVRGPASIVTGTNETELAEADSASPGSNRRTQLQYSTDAAHNWAWTGSDLNSGIVVEYAQAVADPRSGAVVII